MKRRIVLYGAVVLALTGVGIAASILFVEDETPRAVDEPTAARAVAPVERPAAPERPAPESEPDASVDAGPVEVVAVRGTASWAEEGGEWAELVPGQLLGVDDAVRTEDKSGITLKVGDESSIDVADEAEVRVREVSDTVQRFGLVKGRLSVDYREGGKRVLRVENADGTAVAEATEGVFSVLSTGETVAVATETGSVDLSAAGERVTVTAGKQSIVGKGAPSRPKAIPVDVLLRVVDPGCRVQREAFITMRGRAAPGSSVLVNGTSASVSANGRFSARVPLKVGKNNIIVVTRDVVGREKRRSFPCVTVDPGAPIKGIDIEWGAPEARGES